MKYLTAVAVAAVLFVGCGETVVIQEPAKPVEPELTQNEKDVLAVEGTIEATVSAVRQENVNKYCSLHHPIWFKKLEYPCKPLIRYGFRTNDSAVTDTSFAKGIKKIVVKGDIATLNYYGASYRRLVRDGSDWLWWPAGVPIKASATGGYSA